MSFTRFCVRNSVAVNLLMWSLIIGGLYQAATLTRDFFPNSAPERIFITVPYPGATPEEIEKTVTLPIERELRDVEDLKELRSTVFEGVSLTDLELEQGVDYERILNEVRGEIDKARTDLPDGAEEPEIVSIRPFIPVITLALHGEISEIRLHEVALEVRDDLLDLPGVSNVVLTGIRDREIVVEIDPARLEEYGLTLEEVGRILGVSNLDIPGGQLKTGEGNYRVRTLGERDRATAIEEMVVKARSDGTLVRIHDLAQVREDFADTVEQGRFRGRRAVSVIVFKTPEEDAIRISEEVREWAAAHPTFLGGAVEVTAYNNLARFIEQRLDLMRRNALYGLMLVLLALGLFLDLKVAMWVAAGLPVAFLGTFILMGLLGATINLISLFGLIVVLGLIVDDAIVIGENIFTRLRGGLGAEEAAVVGTREVGIPVVTAVLTTMAAFLPLAFLEGRVGVFLGVLPLVVIAALAVSLLEAFVILPVHLAHAARPRRPRFPRLYRLAEGAATVRQRILEGSLPRAYEGFLRLVVRWRYVTVAAVVALALASAGFAAGGHVPFVLLDDADAETVTVDLEMAAGTAEEATARVLEGLETLVAAQPEVKCVTTTHGVSFSDQGRELAADPAIVGQLNAELQPAEDRNARGERNARQLTADLARKAAGIAGVSRLTVGARSGGPAGADIEVRLRGEDLESLAGARDFVRKLLAEYEGVVSIEDDLRRGKLEARLELRDHARLLGLTTRDLALAVRHALFGFEVQEIQSQDESVKVRVRLPEEFRRRLGDLLGLRLPTPEGGRVPLGEVASVRLDRGYATLSRVERRRAVTVRADVDESRANTAAITQSLGRDLEKLGEIHPGTTWSFEGQKKQTSESLGSLRIGFPAALLFIYVLVAILFRSYLQPFLVMLVIPFSFVGVLAGHLVMGYPITLLSMIGGVALSGIVVNDSLILVHAVNRLRREEGLPLGAAVIKGARSRLRAVLLTTVTTMLGLAPLMLEQSFQARFLIPMAISIVFGLAFATILTLVLLPCCYLIMEDVRRLVRWLFGLPLPGSPGVPA